MKVKPFPDGSYACTKADWDADGEKKATGIADGVGLKIITEGQYENGIDNAFAFNEHWYLY